MDRPPTTHENFTATIWGADLALRRVHLDPPPANAPVSTPPTQTPTKTPIVFLHDSLGCTSAWRSFPDRLCAAAGREGLIYDREGFGRSSPLARPRTQRYLHDEAAVLTEVMDAAGIHQATLFGHSDGATIALLAAALFPERITALVSIGAHVIIEDRTLDGLRDALPWWDDPRFHASMTRHHADKAEAVFRVWTQTWLSNEFAGWQMLDELSAIRCPTLVMQGELDEYATPDHVDIIVSRLAGPKRGWVIPGRGHTPYREGPEVLDAAADFLADLP